MVSEVAIGGMVAGGVTALNLAFNFAMTRKAAGDRRTERTEDHREWYRRTMFEKRLTTVQEASEWLGKLHRGIDEVRRAGAVQAGSNAMTAEAGELSSLAEDARAWHDGNTLFLHDDLPGASSFVGLTTNTLTFAHGRKTPDDAWRSYDKTEAELRERAKSLMALEAERPA